MAVTQFSLFHTQYGETVDMIEMDEDLLRPEAGIVDVESMTLRPLKGGGNFTIIPADDYRVATLKRVHDVHSRVTTTGCNLASQWTNRMDEMLMAVELLFKPIKFKLVENAQDMQNLIDPPDDLDYEPKVIEHNVLDDLLGAVGFELNNPAETASGE